MVSDNPIDQLEKINEIAKLPNLRVLAFQCEHFAECPVVNINGYKSYVLSTIQAKHCFQKLDCEKIEPENFQIA
jgi:hypothetical protein